MTDSLYTAIYLTYTGLKTHFIKRNAFIVQYYQNES